MSDFYNPPKKQFSHRIRPLIMLKKKKKKKSSYRLCLQTFFLFGQSK